MRGMPGTLETIEKSRAFLVRDLPPTANPYRWTGREVAADAAE